MQSTPNMVKGLVVFYVKGKAMNHEWDSISHEKPYLKGQNELAFWSEVEAENLM
jgi:hypothetical protein